MSICVGIQQSLCISLGGHVVYKCSMFTSRDSLHLCSERYRPVPNNVTVSRFVYWHIRVLALFDSVSPPPRPRLLESVTCRLQWYSDKVTTQKVGDCQFVLFEGVRYPRNLVKIAHCRPQNLCCQLQRYRYMKRVYSKAGYSQLNPMIFVRMIRMSGHK